MILLLYVFPIIGALVLASDVRGSLSFERDRLRWLRAMGLGSTGLVAGAAIIAIIRAPDLGSSPALVALAASYVAICGVFILSALAAGPRARMVQRVSYGALLLVSLLPSWMFLALTPAVALAALALARASRDAEGHSRPSPSPSFR